MSPEKLEILKAIFADSNYRFCEATDYLPLQFRKGFSLTHGTEISGVAYFLRWEYECVNCGKFGIKENYFCHFATGERTRVVFVQDSLNIQQIEERAKALFDTGLFAPFEIFDTETSKILAHLKAV